MSVPLEQVFSADCMEVRFPSFYDERAFVRDVSRLRALVGIRHHGQKIPYTGDGKDFIPAVGKNKLSEEETAEVAELRKRIRRVDTDVAMLLVIETRLGRRGYNFF